MQGLDFGVPTGGWQRAGALLAEISQLQLPRNSIVFTSVLGPAFDLGF